MLSFVILVLGFSLLVCGADRFVIGSSLLAEKFGIPSLIIGLTVVAFGTSAPELAVSVSASLVNANEIALGNVLGSNIFNLLFVGGVCAMIAPLAVEADSLKRDWVASVFATAFLFLLLCIDGDISRIDAFLLLCGFAVIMFLQIRVAVKNKVDNSSEFTSEILDTKYEDLPSSRVDDEDSVYYNSVQYNAVKLQESDSDISNDSDILYKTSENERSSKVSSTFDKLSQLSTIWSNIIIGLICIIAGGQLSVSGATELARIFGLSETLIGLTIVAIGTSLPELVTSIVATKRGENSIAIGNIIGSNLFNILFILGVSCFINPISIHMTALFDTLILFIATLWIFILAKRNSLNSTWGALLCFSYLMYTCYIIVR